MVTKSSTALNNAITSNINDDIIIGNGYNNIIIGNENNTIAPSYTNQADTISNTNTINNDINLNVNNDSNISTNSITMDQSSLITIPNAANEILKKSDTFSNELQKSIKKVNGKNVYDLRGGVTEVIKSFEDAVITWIDGKKDEKITKKDFKDKLLTGNQFNRVSLNVCPVTYRNDNTYYPSGSVAERLSYVLGSNENGLLRRKFGSTYGLIFPYTPSISMSYQAEYDSSTIIHSNLSINMYKNTPPSNIQLNADFTADNEINGEYMYAAIIFLKAMTKTDFGIEAKRRNAAGMPPPILYLNGWGSTYYNIPVVIKSFNVQYDKNHQYVYLKNLDVWVPTDMSFQIDMIIQPNLEKYKYQFDLDAFKNNTLNDVNNIALVDAQDIVNGIAKGKGEVVENLAASSTMKAIEENMPLKQQVGDIVDAYKNVYKISTYKKKTKFSGHGWTW